MKAKDIMTKEVITVNKEDEIENVVKIFLTNKISGVPVVDDYDKVVGIISETDLVKKNASVYPPNFITLLSGVIYLDSIKKYEKDLKVALALKAKELMSSKVIFVREEDDLQQVSDLMIKKSINRVPVLDKNNVIKGIICRYDLIKAFFDIK